MKTVFVDLEGVFDAFSYPYKVDEERGVIHLSLNIKIRAREVTKFYDLKLPKKSSSFDQNSQIVYTRFKIDKLREQIYN